MKTDPLKIPLFQRTSICMATDGISWNCFRHCHHAKKNRFQMKTSEKRKQTDCYNPPFPSQLCPSAAPPAEPLAQWAACHALDGKLGPQCAHNIHHVGRIWDFLTCGHMKKSNCQFLIAETQKMLLILIVDLRAVYTAPRIRRRAPWARSHNYPWAMPRMLATPIDIHSYTGFHQWTNPNIDGL